MDRLYHAFSQSVLEVCLGWPMDHTTPSHLLWESSRSLRYHAVHLTAVAISRVIALASAADDDSANFMYVFEPQGKPQKMAHRSRMPRKPICTRLRCNPCRYNSVSATSTV